MSCWIVGGPRWGVGKIDQDWHRTWPVTFVVQTDDMADGPAVAVQTPGLPIQGDIYVVGNEVDIWAWFRAGPTTITPDRDKGGNQFFYITYEATTRPASVGGPGGRDDKGERKKCADQRIENPLAEPPAVSVASVAEQQEQDYDKDGRAFMYTSFEHIKGKDATFDRCDQQVTIEMNVLDAERTITQSFMELLNNAPLWGFPERCWKLVDWSADRKLYGLCGFYHVKKMVFRCKAEFVPDPDGALLTHPVLAQWLKQGPDGRWWLPRWDNYVLDNSMFCLKGKWRGDDWVDENFGGAAPDPTNPLHYMRARDRSNQPARINLSRTRKGRPMKMSTVAQFPDEDANWIRMQRYNVGSYLTLGIPANID